MTARGRLPRQLHLAVELPAADGRGGPQPDFGTYVRLARAAERGLFDFLLLTGGPRPAAYDGRTAGERAEPGGWVGPDRCGPEPVTVLHALAAVTERIGLAVAAAPDPAGRGPYDLARRVAALDRLSGGRAAGPPGEQDAGAPGAPVTIAVGGGAAAEDAVEVLVADAPVGGPRAARRARVLSRIGVPADEPSGAWAREFADRLHTRVLSGAVDGFVLHPPAGPRGLDAFVEWVVPLLQQRGALRTGYSGTTLRDHLGLPRPLWKAETV